ncbi:hypothetical protein LCGC14_1611080 [marine sediment metagenome]|uniref:Uncharacterized protein n=1 Tax=marine sediment metagenome TaxID=412755 RepID=A0A0F9IUZ7_9ZZZZ
MGLFHARVGAISAAEGSINPLTTDTTGAVRLTGGAGKYGDLVLADKVFSATNTAAVALSADDTLVFTGLVLENPVTSGKNYVMLMTSWLQTIATPTAGGLGLQTGIDAGDAATGIAARNSLIGSSITSDAVVDTGCTLVGTPISQMLFSTNWAEATTAGSQQPLGYIDINGLIVLKPGAYCATYSAVGETAAFWFTFTWAEFNV